MSNKKTFLSIVMIMSFGLLTLTANSLGIHAQVNQTGQENNQSSSQLLTNVTALNNVTNTTILAVSEGDAKEIQQIMSDVQQNLNNRTDSIYP